MSNPFKDWSPEKVASHNAKVAGGSVPSGDAVEALLRQDRAATPNLSVSPSTDEQKLNKLEKAWLAQLRRLNHPFLGVQSVTFKLGSDCRFTPDFTIIDENGQLVAYETKGFMRDDALVKLKVAARTFRWVRFVLVERKKGEWIQTPVQP